MLRGLTIGSLTLKFYPAAKFSLCILKFPVDYSMRNVCCQTYEEKAAKKSPYTLSKHRRRGYNIHTGAVCLESTENGGINMKRIALEELKKKCPGGDYMELYAYIMELVSSGAVKPVKASGANGKTPALYRDYWLMEEEPDYAELTEELTYALTPMISNDYYLAHLDVYEKERDQVLRLNAFLRDRREALDEWESINERSFEIWGQEKFLKKGGGMTLLKHCGIEPGFLHYYETTEPMAVYTHTRQVPQNLLILENKDTFYSMRRHLLEEGDMILGVKVGTLIYGAGKGILRSFRDFSVCAEPYMQNKENHIFYLGDLDYEGIGIYENLAEFFSQVHEILPFVPGYRAMLEKAAVLGGTAFLPLTKEGQNRGISTVFFSFFPIEERARMGEILEGGRYIPQEILSGRDFGMKEAESHR